MFLPLIKAKEDTTKPHFLLPNTKQYILLQWTNKQQWIVVLKSDLPQLFSWRTYNLL